MVHTQLGSLRTLAVRARPPAWPHCIPGPPAWIGWLLASALCVSPAEATKGGPPNYPKVLAHVRNIATFSPGQLDTLSWFDMVNTATGSPEIIAAMRSRNPHQRIFFRHMPQTIVNWQEGDDFWHADTAWSLVRLMQYYALQNDWFLYDTEGERIPEWNGYSANWTRYCPLGTYGTSQGMTIAEWYVDVALPQIAYHSIGGEGWPEAWGWGSSAFDGLAWEVFVDCPAVSTPDAFAAADPDRDGEPEGIDDLCWDGGDLDSLSVLYREANAYIQARLRVVHPDLVMLSARASWRIKPAWVWEELNGLKLEEWNPYAFDPNASYPLHHYSWWSWMYGRRHGPQGSGGTLVGDGYRFAEQVMHPFGNDALEGWDVTYIQYYPGRGWHPTPAEEERVLRLGLGTALLGDGYFCLTYDEVLPVWVDLFDWDFGDPLGNFTRELVGSDTLYVRRFTEGFVEVNPYHFDLGPIPAGDARFAFWLTVDDLATGAVGATSVELTWTAPAGEINGVDETLMRYAAAPITAGNWAAASVPPGSVPLGPPGAPVSFEVSGLLPETTYYFALRNVVHGRVAPGVSSNASATTPSAVLPDTLGPSAIEDLTVTAFFTDGFDLVWTAPGDDGDVGTASYYLLGYLAGEVISDSIAWDAAVKISDSLPVPETAGTPQTYRLSGLMPETLYGLSLRAYDEADNSSPLASPPVSATTLPVVVPDQTPPGAITVLALDQAAPTWARLRWLCTGDDDTLGVASAFVLGWIRGEQAFDEIRWEQATHVSEGLPLPDSARVEVFYVLGGLDPEQAYSVTVRARDDVELLSPLGTTLIFTTPAPPDTVLPDAIGDLRVEASYPDGFALAWTAPGDDANLGTASGYELAYRAGAAIADTADWNAAIRIMAGLPAPAPAGTDQAYRLTGLEAETTYGLSLRAYDDVGGMSPLAAPPLMATTTAVADTIPPGAITTLGVEDLGSSWVHLTWICSGGDDSLGIAESFELAWMPGPGPFTELLWETALHITAGLPAPDSAGTQVGFALSGLLPEATYVATVRARDTAALLSPLGNSLSFTTLALPVPPPPPDTIPPAAIDDLLVSADYTDGFDLEWTAPGDDGDLGTAASYVLGYLEGGEIADSTAWQEAVRIESGLPAPAGAGSAERYRLTELAPGTVYGLALRAYDDVGGLSPLPAEPLLALTREDPDTQPPGAVASLTLGEYGPTWAELMWICPGQGDPPQPPVGFVLGWITGTGPFTEALWHAATQVSAGLPVADSVGAQLSYTLTGLGAAQTYTATVRARGAGELLSPLGGQATFTTPGMPDTTAPARIADLSVSEVGETWASLQWTAVGDDSTSGQATTYQLGVLAGEVIDEANWEAAVADAPQIPPPAPAGTAETYTLAGLTPGISYSIALRAFDEVGNPAPLSNTVSAGPPLPPVVVPPDAVLDLEVSEAGIGWLDLTWSAPAAHEPEGPVTRYWIRYASIPVSAEAWDEMLPAADPPPPLPPGAQQSYRLGSLHEGERYWIALRSQDGAGHVSETSNIASGVTARADREPPPAPPAPHATLRSTSGICELWWDPVAAEDLLGYNIYGRRADWTLPERLNPVPVGEAAWSFPAPSGVMQHYVSITAVDTTGNEGPAGPETPLFFETTQLRGPFPHPIRQEARFELTLPPRGGGSVPVRAQIFSVTGEIVHRWVDDSFPAGHRTILHWDTRNDEGALVAPGLYFLKIEIAAAAEIRKIYVKRD
jgi:hypothetical protein